MKPEKALKKIQSQALEVDVVRGVIPNENIQQLVGNEAIISFYKLMSDEILTGDGKSKIVRAGQAYYKKVDNHWYELIIPKAPSPVPPQLVSQNKGSDSVEKDIADLNNQLFKARAYIDHNLNILNKKLILLEERFQRMDESFQKGLGTMQQYIDLKMSETKDSQENENEK